MKFQILCFIVLIGNTLASDWENWKSKHNKTYRSHEDESHRKEIFKNHTDFINKHNSNPNKSYTLATNHLSDLTPEEYKKLLGAKIPDNVRMETINFDEELNDRLATSIDWRTLGAVTAIKNQGYYCGSCWSFASTAALEGQYFRKTGKLVSLSEQQLIDCSRPYGNGGCNGGYPGYAYLYLKYVAGDESEAAYPYANLYGSSGYTCNYNSAYTSYAGVYNYITVTPQGSEAALQAAVSSVGPVSVCIGPAELTTFQHYYSGVYTDTNCVGGSTIDHAVTVVGYGTTSAGQAYWIVRNSWGSSWGMGGYMFMARNQNNLCGIASYATYPILK